ncbi:UDP-N-acetylmuramoyl-L-alanine--D-glutamate ligase [bacterium]|nr:UDP-N-acetylmuramoyl-L-alanine--D-glutamate ligase [bacterium]
MAKPVTPKKKQRALVVGLGRSGVAAVKLLVKKGYKVTVTDELNKTDLKDSLDALESIEFKAELGKHVLKTFSDQDLIVVSPGVRLDIKPLQHAEKAGVPIISEVELAAQYISEPIIAVTGTNGKSTTASLIAEMIRLGGKSVFLGGNIGTALSEYPLRREKADFVVVEVSSFQLDTCRQFKPHVAVVLNVAPDHLDRYTGFDAYAASKARIQNNMTEEDYLIFNHRDAKLTSLLAGTRAKVLHFTSEPLARMDPAVAEKFQGAYLGAPHMLQLKAARWKDHAYPVSESLLRGIHNRENMLAAVLAAKLAGISNESIHKALVTFKPLPHRMEFVGRKNQVYFYNDSKGTNVHSLMRSLESFNEPVILIAGGRDKGEDYGPLAPSIRRHVKNLILVGEAKEKLNRAIGDFSETFLVGTFEEAVYLAYQKSRSGDVILLSPGCASQDMFKNFEERGNYFKKIVSTF